MEASSPQKAGDKARLITLPIKAKPNGRCMLRFFYHMNGEDVDELRVYVLKEKTGLLDLRFKDSVNYGDIWKAGYVDLSKDIDKFRLVFEGMRRNEIYLFVCLFLFIFINNLHIFAFIVVFYFIVWLILC